MKYNDPTGHCVDGCILELGAACLLTGICQTVANLVAQVGPQVAQAGMWLANNAPGVSELGNWMFNSDAGEQAVHSANQNAGNSTSGAPNDPWNRFRKPELVDKNLVDRLQKEGIKHNADNILRIGQVSNGRVVFLETGSNTAGLQHIINAHGSDFANRGVSIEQIPDLVMKALSDNNIVGSQGAGRPIYETIFNGTKQLVAITVGSNGYIVGANPASLP